MSLGSTLASRIANLFSPGSSSGNQQDHNDIGFVDDGCSQGKQSFADVKLGASDFTIHTMASKAVEEEEEGRPPYIHVSGSHEI
jgi:hypothetical protein